jgi:hypothetical protein
MDLLVYAPAGLVLAVLDDLPGLAAKGRTRISGQVRSARTVGQMVVLFGRADLERRIGGLWADRAPAPPPPPPPQSQPQPRPPATTSPEQPTDEPADDPGRAGADGPGPTVGGPVRDIVTTTASSATASSAAAATDAAPTGAAPTGDGPTGDGPTGTASAAAPGPVDLAIPGYDTLSASQVVRRLDSLGPGELAAVHAHESTTRNRRTILSRVEQLQAGGTGPGVAPPDPGRPPGPS